MDAQHWNSHLSDEAKRRQPSLAKSLYKYIKPEMKSLGGGLPAADMFPVHKATFEVPQPSADMTEETEPAARIPIDLYNGVGANGEFSTVCLREAQQYAAFTMFPPLQHALWQLTTEVHNPPPQAGHSLMGNLGNTDGLHKALRILLNPGDNLLVEEHCFSPPVEQARAQGSGLVPVRLDSEGLVAAHLEELLSTWNTAHGPKPRVLYTITTGQNPTGTTPGPRRLQDIYNTCKKHDVVIIEDDPYYFLQFSPYGSAPNQPTKEPLNPSEEASAAKDHSISAFADTMTKTLLSLDVDGRVIRLDSLSKIVFPGSRVGWTTCNGVFKERMERMSEVTTQVGAGVNQAFFAQLLTEPSNGAPNPGGWGVTGLLRWINQVRRTYTKKRDLFLDVLDRELPPSLGLVKTVAPLAGMFCWISVDLTKHPKYKVNPSAPATKAKTNTVEIMEDLFDKLAANNCLILPARFFSVNHQLPAGVPQTADLLPCVDDRNNVFRATFAGKEEDIEAALVIFGQLMRSEFGV